MPSISKQLESKFSAEEIEEIISRRLLRFNPTASAAQEVNGSIGCACNILINDDVCPAIDKTEITFLPLPLLSLSIKGKPEVFVV